MEHMAIDPFISLLGIFVLAVFVVTKIFQTEVVLKQATYKKILLFHLD